MTHLGNDSAPSKELRPQNDIVPREPLLDIRPELLRAVEVSTALRRCGILWRKSPIDMTPDAKANLWEFSKPVKKIDSFLSHTWATPGWQKYIVLTMKYNWRLGAIVGLLTLAVLVSCKLCNAYPPHISTDVVSNPGWEAEVPNAYPLCLICVPPLTLSAIFGRNLLPRKMRNQRTAFLDVVCINQCDKDLMLEGIYGLAAFLKASKELLILWSPPYFSRLWCVYEVAAFHALHALELHTDTGTEQSTLSLKDDSTYSVSFCPLFTFLSGLAIYLAIWLLLLINAVATRLQWIQLDTVGYAIIFAFIFLVAMFGFTFMTHWFRALGRDKNDLVHQFQRFDIANAGCRMESDREYVHEAVLKWFKSHQAFNTYVRNEMYKDVYHSRELEFTFFHAVGFFFPVICYNVDAASTYLMVSELPPEVRFGIVLSAMTSGTMGGPLGLYVASHLCTRLAAKRESRLADLFTSVSVVAGGLTTSFLLMGSGYLASGIHFSLSICHFVLLVGLSCVAMRTREAMPEPFQALQAKDFTVSSSNRLQVTDLPQGAVSGAIDTE